LVPFFSAFQEPRLQQRPISIGRPAVSFHTQICVLDEVDENKYASKWVLYGSTVISHIWAFSSTCGFANAAKKKRRCISLLQRQLDVEFKPLKHGRPKNAKKTQLKKRVGSR